jgi:hypothetical protein
LCGYNNKGWTSQLNGRGQRRKQIIRARKTFSSQKGHIHWPQNFRQIMYNDLAVKVKGKVVPVLPSSEHHAMKAHWGSGGTAPPVL